MFRLQSAEPEEDCQHNVVYLRMGVAFCRHFHLASDCGSPYILQKGHKFINFPPGLDATSVLSLNDQNSFNLDNVCQIKPDENWPYLLLGSSNSDTLETAECTHFIIDLTNISYVKNTHHTYIPQLMTTYIPQLMTTSPPPLKAEVEIKNN